MSSVYLVTNREFNKKAKDVEDLFDGDDFNKKGPSELRFVRVDYEPNHEKKEYNMQYELYPDNAEEGSHKIFTDLQSDMKQNSRDTLIFVHGYNNDWKTQLNTAIRLAQIYNINVIAFTWPSSGLFKYRNCKDRAIESVPAFNRFIELFIKYMGGTTEMCGQRVNLLCHSMGNYILKNFIKSSHYENEFIPFHNVNLVAADVNHEKHWEWVDKIACLNEVNVFINQDDIALDFSDTKRGPKQKKRLGNTISELKSNVAHYYNVSNAKGVKKAHGYHENKDVLQNKAIWNLFNMAFHGERIEGMTYVKGLNFYVVPEEYREKKSWLDSINLPDF